ncbi:hypothetical protein E8E14_000810 [Neopestalotiopsis sp. 37M]|nr:hypothetical protein E8E14_000810 [Neopestalotiopsis sp. 37M]
MSIYFPVSIAKNGTASSGEDQSTLPSLPLLGLNQNALCFIKSSIAECLQRCGHEASAGLLALPSRLIKVEHGLVRLVEIGDISYTGHLPFTTLSYCWGNSPQLKLERDTLNRMQGGIPIKDLAAAHRDAIILTGMLSIPYIWVGALCIFQDDAEDWAQESEKMSGIYASSILTICAVSSGSSDEGFLDSTLPSVTIPFKDSADDTKTETYEVRGFVIPESERGGWPIWDAIPHKNSSWCGRSWTYQEQIFSQRRLYFTSLGLIFNCSNFWYSEATRTKRDPNYPGLEQRPDPQSRNGLYSGWKHMIQDYSPRHITKISDHLPALSGLARQFSHTLQDDYFAGLWRGKLLQGLSWSSFHSSISTLENLVETLEAQVQEGIPTWTWLNRGSVDTAGLCSEMYRASCNVIEASVTPKYADPYGQISGSRLVLEAPVLSLDTSSIINPAAPWWNNVPLGSTHVRIDPDWLPEESEALPSTLFLLMLYIMAPSEADYARGSGIVVHPVGQQGFYYRVGAFFVSFDTPADADEFLVECESCRRTVELI